MCGIFGGIKNVKPESLKILGILNEDKGTDATGLFDADGYIKDNKSFREFILADTDEYIKDFKGYLVGHTRFSTTGANSQRNAHPFTFGNITGVHNGMLRNFEELKKYYDVRDLECDSEILFYLLDKKGIEGLKEVVGYFTIVWSDITRPDKLYFIQHECSLSYNRGKDYLYFSTDADDLEVALGVNIKTISLDSDTLYEIDINTLKIKKSKVAGLKADVSGFITYKTSADYQKDWEGILYKDTPPVSACDIAWDEEDYNKDVQSKKWNKQNKKYWKTQDKKNLTDKKYSDYAIMCPYCNESIYVDEVHKRQCPYCRTQLTGVVYECYHCTNLVLMEQITDEDRCPICDLHMVLDEKHLVTV